jgi:hypothetical protein
MIDFTRPGRMISGTKTAPKGHVCVFNANLCTRSAGKIWFGDIDLTSDKPDLQRLADEKGEAIYVLREMDARFMNEASPKFENAVAVIEPKPAVQPSTSQTKPSVLEGR